MNKFVPLTCYVKHIEKGKKKLQPYKHKYTNYILVLQDILTDAQALILHLSKGYKTASRVDHEWREKMRNVLKEFQMFVHDFAGGSPESNQYFFDVPAMLKTTAPIVDNPIEDPFDGEKPWWERVSSGCRPFLMFGDMAEFKPPQRREVLHAVK
ncbi:Endonuclease III, partial [Operophtera brumata]